MTSRRVETCHGCGKECILVLETGLCIGCILWDPDDEGDDL